MTEWRSVASFEGVYEVSDGGQVRRVCGGRGAIAGKILTPRVRSKGYLRVVLHDGDHVSEISVHRLVALAFLPSGAADQVQVNHRDGNPANNSVSNLEWSTGAENMRHAAEVLGRRRDWAGEKNGNAKLTADQVREIRSLQGQRAAVSVARDYGVSNQLIGMIWRRTAWATIV